MYRFRCAMKGAAIAHHCAGRGCAMVVVAYRQLPLRKERAHGHIAIALHCAFRLWQSLCLQATEARLRISSRIGFYHGGTTSWRGTIDALLSS
jgi:hypothetical protein